MKREKTSLIGPFKDVFNFIKDKWEPGRKRTLYVIPLSEEGELMGTKAVASLTGRNIKFTGQQGAVYREALLADAGAVLAARTTPNKRLKFSNDDTEFVWKLRQAGRLLGIPIMDFLIFNKEKALSMRAEGMFMTAPGVGL